MAKTNLDNRSNNPQTFKVLWLKDQLQKLRKIFTIEEISNEDLKNLLLEEYDSKTQLEGRFFNNVTKDNTIMTLEQFINKYLQEDLILSGYNTLIANQKNAHSYAIDALVYILKQRAVYKKNMINSKKGSEEYVYWQVLQLTMKILANSYYGVLSQAVSTFYNSFIQNSITLTGQDLISVSIYFIESFLSNNKKFDNLDDVIDFINNICTEKDYNILDYVNNIKTKDQVKKYLIGHTNVPIDVSILDAILSKRTEEELNKIYYTNQLMELLDNDYFKNKLSTVISTGNIDEDLVKLISKINSYNYVTADRFSKITSQTRKSVLVSDTDSIFVHLDKHLENIVKITGTTENKDDVIINLLIAIITEALDNIFKTFTANCGLPEEYRSIINMKNEFVYSKLITTRNKKNYAGWLNMELGKIIPGNDAKEHLDIKGLAIRKSTISKTLRKEFQKFLVDDILKPEQINLVKVMESYNTISDLIESSLKRGSTEFLIPKSLAEYNSYKFPNRIEAVRGTIVWNAIEPDKVIIPPEKILTVKINGEALTSKGFEKIKEINPEKYELIKNTVFTSSDAGDLDLSKFGFNVLSIPMDEVKVPDYILPAINYESMINANLKAANILLESLGIYCTDDNTTKTNYKSNIIEL